MVDSKKLKIKERLDKGFTKAVSIANIGALVAVIVAIIIAVRYSYALKNYGFSQGDIGKAMTIFADTRSATRGIIGYQDTDMIDSLIDTHASNKEKFEEYWKDIEATLVNSSEKEAYEAADAQLEAYWEIDEEIISIGATPDPELSEQAQEKAMAELGPAYSSIYEDLQKLMDLKVEEGNKVKTTLNVIGIAAVLGVIVVIIVGAILAKKLGAKIAEGISGPLNELSDRFKTFARGDLGSPFPETDSEDEVAEMVYEAKKMAENLNAIISDVGNLLTEMANGNYAVGTTIEEKYEGDFSKLLLSMREMNRQMNATLREIEEAANQVSLGSENLAEAAQSLAEGATDQAGSVEELQATFANITEGVQKTAERVEESHRQAKQYAAEADNSRAEMEAMIEAMNRITETSEKIGNIISDIEEIASETNLLSLNAAIEAARAGEAGKGFAVVADQIRKLAEQSAQSAVDTRQLIENTLEEISQGNKAADSAATSIEEVVKGIKSIADSSRDLSEISVEQAEAVEQAEEGVNQISEIIQSNSASAEESSATSEELSAQAIAMSELVGKFVLRKE